MLSFLLGLVPGVFSTINSITSAISNEKIAQINATTDVEKASIQAKIDQLQSQRDVLIADSQNSNIDLWIRAGFAFPPMVYFCKIFAWDKVWASWPTFETPPMSTNDMYVVMAVLGFYFLYSTARLFK
jgi:hypothetical protein